uniref:NADH-ubiquinone oxidoreductase chain 5 n=1 Tax=Colasposoma dauricum TaxID=1301243 RepID=A0A7U1AQA1_9CUCU|nr:NADH dehydrogenase subunit 5 [Colasposoma dauricum]QQY84942.1 NADH dehydrogenase subunit 5 [Colasposoma dauricum]
MICNIYSYFFFILSFSLFMLSMMFSMLDYCLVMEYNLLMYTSLNISMVILLDWMSLLFMSFVLFISCMVIYYSGDYMYGDLNLNRFIMLVVMFVLSMMLLIISPNLVSILLGWDGLGLVSYCLVIYYQNVKSYNAGMLTALTNRIGDVALLMSIAWMLNFGSWNYIFYLQVMYDDYCMQIISFLIVLAAMTKSAQIPFSSWLPAAMAAPTPVSSLVHSSTLVTAGIYLLIRFSDSFHSYLMFLMLFFSMMTMFMSGMGANFEFDLKKVIALSTLSQLGLMMGILSLGSMDLAFFHLLTHALFKALLFMCAGLIIHNFSNMQDIRYLGGLINHMPISTTLMMICNFSLCGLPFLSGFYSKDLIVEVLSMNYLNMFVYMIFYVSIGLTVCYSFRLSYYLLFGSYNFMSISSLIEENSMMLKGMFGLILLVVFMGSLLSWVIFMKPFFIFLPLLMKVMTLIFISMGVYLGSESFKFNLSYEFSKKSLNLKYYLGSMWNMPFLSTIFIYSNSLFMGLLYLKKIDQGWIEFYGSKNLSLKLTFMSSLIQYFSLNHFKLYILVVLLWILGFMIFI